VVILLEDPALGSDGGRREQSQKVLSQVGCGNGVGGEADKRLRSLRRGWAQRALVDGAIIGQRAGGNLGDNFTVLRTRSRASSVT
jgi:hypothetical protein